MNDFKDRPPLPSDWTPGHICNLREAARNDDADALVALGELYMGPCPGKLYAVPLVAASSSAPLRLSHRDRRVVDLALAKLRGTRVDFAEAMRALKESAEELIPDGRIFLLGVTDTGPIVGSIVSWVGIVEREQGIELLRARPNVSATHLGWFGR